MRILGVESSSLVASVAIVTDDVVTAEYTVNLKKTHSQTLLPMIDQMMGLLEMELDTVDARYIRDSTVFWILSKW